MAALSWNALRKLIEVMIIKKGWLFTYILQDKELNIGLIFFISGGIVEFSQNTNALEKWTLTAHLRAAVSANFKTTLELGGTLKEDAPQITKSGKSEKIQELLRAISRVSNLFTFDRTLMLTVSIH